MINPDGVEPCERRYALMHVGCDPVASLPQDAPIELIVSFVTEAARIAGGLVRVERD